MDQKSDPVSHDSPMIPFSTDSTLETDLKFLNTDSKQPVSETIFVDNLEHRMDILPHINGFSYESLKFSLTKDYGEFLSIKVVIFELLFV